MFYSARYMYRRYTLDDTDLLIALYEDWEWQDVTTDFVKNHLKTLIFKQYEEYNTGVLAVFEKETGNYVGHCGIKYIAQNDEYHLSFRFLKHFWKNNQPLEPINTCVKHAFNQLNINEIIVDLDKKSNGAAKMLEKANFKHRITISDNNQILYRYSIFNAFT